MLEKIGKKFKDQFYFGLRVVAGLLFFLHGMQKFGFIIIGENVMSVSGFAGMFGLPVFIAFMVSLVEVVGGLFIMLGFHTRLAAAVSALVMVGAYAIAHIPNGVNPLGNGGEVALLYLAIFLMLKVHGSGRWALDNLQLMAAPIATVTVAAPAASAEAPPMDAPAAPSMKSDTIADPEPVKAETLNS